jgi:hypothetical protein
LHAYITRYILIYISEKKARKEWRARTAPRRQ